MISAEQPADAQASHVYILAHRTAPWIKIGRADNIANRARAIGVGAFDLSRCIGLRLSSSVEADNLERLLHRAFVAWRIPADDVTSGGGPLDGATEWFRDDCLERLRSFLRANRDLFGFEEVDVVVPIQRPTPARRWQRPQPRVQDEVEVEACLPLEPGDLDTWMRLVCIGTPTGDHDDRHYRVKGSGADVLVAMGASQPYSRRQHRWLRDSLTRISTASVSYPPGKGFRWQWSSLTSGFKMSWHRSTGLITYLSLTVCVPAEGTTHIERISSGMREFIGPGPRPLPEVYRRDVGDEGPGAATRHKKPPVGGSISAPGRP